MNDKNYDIEVLKSKRFLTKDETAFYLGISKKLLTKIMLYSDFYPLMRIGHNRGRVFINREKLDKWIDEQDGSYKDLK